MYAKHKTYNYFILKSKGDGEKTIKAFGVHSVGFVSCSKHNTTILSQ